MIITFLGWTKIAREQQTVTCYNNHLAKVITCNSGLAASDNSTEFNHVKFIHLNLCLLLDLFILTLTCCFLSWKEGISPYVVYVDKYITL